MATMLFSGCNCIPDPSALGSLCAGGAGFVSAMMAAMVAGARTSEARPLGRAVPEVDRLAVRIVTDNIVIQFVPNEKRGGLTIERRGGNTTPDAPPRTALNGEWGLSMHMESHAAGEARHVMIDFGYTPEVLLNNLAILKIDPSTIDAIVLSHGHYDHFGGMTGFLKATKGKLKGKLPFFVGGEDAFCLRKNPGGNFGALDRRAIMDADLALMLSEGPALVADHAFTTGRIGQVSFEKPLQPSQEIVGIFDGGFGCFPEKMPAAKNVGQYIPDDFDHEIGTAYMVRGKGLVVLTSCSHRGVINTVRAAQKASGIDKVHAVIGGFHIVPPLNDDYIHKTIEEFKAIDPDHLIPAHCTGDRFYDLAREAMGDKVIHSAVGTRFIFQA
jgi:7,8-dihydropterin-6-yl-methyl-4-(beta-D-ribofuranosyl)aminobenzene 5'-phosphate synthase